MSTDPLTKTHFFFFKKSLLSIILQPKTLSNQFSTIPLEQEPLEPSSPPHQLDQNKLNEGILAMGCAKLKENCKAEV